MNAQQKAKILREAGYVDIKTPKDYQWYWNDTVVSWTDDKGSIPHTTDAAYEHYLKDHATVPAVESPTPDSIEIPCVLEDKNARIAELESQLGEHRIERLALLNKVETLEFDDKIKADSIDNLHNENVKLKADLVAAQNIIVQARKDFEALKQLTGYAYRCDYCHTPMNKARRVADTAGGDSQVCETCYPFADEPAQEVTHVTTTLMVDDIVIHKRGNGAQMVVNEIIGNRCRVVYRHSKNQDLREFLIDDLVLDYRPSWNKTAIAKQNAEES